MDIDYDLIIAYMWENITFEVFLKFVLVYFFIIWISLIVWVIKDISNRTESILLQLLAVLSIVILSPLWIFVYLIIRPGKTLFEKYYEEIEYNLDTVENIVEDKNCIEDETMHCYSCEYPISHEFSFCPNCNVKLKDECKWCKKNIYCWWKNCPYCWKENNKTTKTFNNKQDKKIIKEKKEIKEDIIINEQEEFEKQK